MTRYLLTLTAVLEAATGLALLAAPSAVAALLIGSPLDAPGAIVVARVTGAAMLSLGMACWLARNDGATRPGRGIVAALLVYNLLVVAILAYTGAVLGLAGIGLWPVAGGHTALAIWCVASLRKKPKC